LILIETEGEKNENENLQIDNTDQQRAGRDRPRERSSTRPGLAQQSREPAYPGEDTEMSIYNVEINFPASSALELCNIPAQSVQDAKRRAIAQARALGYQGKTGKVIVRRSS
jgi:hypothetical protein